MSFSRGKLEKVNAASLVVDHSVNFRDPQGYDLPNMCEEIRVAGKIIEPVHYSKDDRIVLRGNRRILAAQTILKDPTISPELRKNLENVEAFAYTGLDERSRTELVLDHGSQKPLSRVEVIRGVWRLQRLMYSETDIILLLYQQLSKFTGNTRKAWEASQLPAGEAREKVLKSWLHGTVGNFLLAIGQMGELVRDQLILTETERERNLSDEEKARFKFRVDRKRAGELVTAKKEDKDKNGGWTPDAGGKAFNEKIESYIREDDIASGKEKTRGKGGKSDRPSLETVEATADSMQSGMGLAMRAAVGKLADGDKSKLDALDTEYHRRDKLFAILTAAVGNVKDENVKALVNAILTGSPSDVETAVAPFVS